MIRLYYWPTPNGHKISIMLEEIGLAYDVIPVDTWIPVASAPLAKKEDTGGVLIV